MSKFKVTEGTDNYVEKLSKLVNQKELEGICKQALYVGAGIVADEFRNAVSKIPVDNEKAYGGRKTNGLHQKQKDGLLAGIGISRMKVENGEINVKVGFDGYNSFKTKKYPNGQPNSLIARSVVSGTSFRTKNNFVGRAVKAAEAKANAAMEKKFDETTEKMIGG